MKILPVHLSAICLTVFLLVQQVNAANLLIPVGQVIGLEIQRNQVTVAGFDTSLGEAAREAGLLEGDQIMKIDDKQILCTEDVRNALKASDGDVDISVLREKAVHHLEMEPVITPDGPKLGCFCGRVSPVWARLPIMIRTAVSSVPWGTELMTKAEI